MESVDAVLEQISISIKYAGYIDKQQQQASRVAQYESLALPGNMDFTAVAGLSFEVRQTLAKQRPQTLGQASRLSGITPAAISLLLVHLKKRRPPAGDGANEVAAERSAA